MRVITVTELEAMTPAERDRSFGDSIIYDLGQVPEQYRPTLEAQGQRILKREVRRDNVS